MKKPATSAASKAGKVKAVAAKGKASKAKAAKPAKAEPAIEENQIVDFAGYKVETEKPLFNVGDPVLVVRIFEEDGVKKLYGIRPDDKAAYDANPDDPDLDIDELTFDEIKRPRGRAKKVKEAVPEKVINVVSIGELDDLVDEADPVASAKKLLGDINKSYFYLGGILAKLRYQKRFLDEQYKPEDGEPYTDDPKGWGRFVLDQFDFREGKARALMDIYLTFSTIEDFDVSRLESVGWSAAAEASRYIKDDNYEEILDAAESMPILEFKDHIRQTYANEDGTTASGRRTTASRIKTTTFTFKLYEDAGETVQMVLEEACKANGLEMNAAFEHIVTEWANDHLDPAKVKRAIGAGEKRRKDLKKQGVEIPDRPKQKIAA